MTQLRLPSKVFVSQNKITRIFKQKHIGPKYFHIIMAKTKKEKFRIETFILATAAITNGHDI